MCGDNLSSMQIVKNANNFNRSKQIDVRYHFIRSHYYNGNIGLQYVESENLCENFLTKSVVYCGLLCPLYLKERATLHFLITTGELTCLNQLVKFLKRLLANN